MEISSESAGEKSQEKVETRDAETMEHAEASVQEQATPTLTAVEEPSWPLPTDFHAGADTAALARMVDETVSFAQDGIGAHDVLFRPRAFKDLHDQDDEPEADARAPSPPGTETPSLSSASDTDTEGEGEGDMDTDAEAEHVQAFDGTYFYPRVPSTAGKTPPLGALYPALAGFVAETGLLADMEMEMHRRLEDETEMPQPQPLPKRRMLAALPSPALMPPSPFSLYPPGATPGVWGLAGSPFVPVPEGARNVAVEVVDVREGAAEVRPGLDFEFAL